MACLKWGSNPWLLKEKLQVLSSLPTEGCWARSGVYAKIVSQPVLPSQWALGFFVFLYFFSQRKLPSVVIHSLCVSVGGRESGFQRHLLEPECEFVIT